MNVTPQQFPHSSAGTAQESNRIITPRRSPFNLRTVLGAVFVGTAALGTFVVASQLDQRELTEVVTAREDIPAGSRLSDRAIEVQRVQLDPSQRSHTFSSTATLRDAVTLGPIEKGEHVQRGNVAALSREAQTVEISFAIPPSRALNGTLLSGETVDILASPKSSASPQATVVVSRAKVLRSEGSTGAIGKGNEIVITVALPRSTDVAAVATAIDGGTLTLIRTTGAELS